MVSSSSTESILKDDEIAKVTHKTVPVPGTTQVISRLPSSCSLCCLLGLIIVATCLITNIPIACTWSRKNISNCISLFFAIIALNFVVLSLFTLLNTLLENCLGFQNTTLQYVFLAFCFLVYTNCCLLTCLMSVYHYLMTMHGGPVQWDLWTKAITVQALAVSFALTVIIGITNLLFSGILPESEENTVVIIYSAAQAMPEELIFTLWFYGVLRIGTCIVVSICSILTLTTSPPPESSGQSVADQVEITDDLVGPQGAERRDKYMKPMPSHQVDPNKLLAQQLKGRRTSDQMEPVAHIKSKVVAESSSSNVSIREAIMKQAMKEFFERKRGREMNTGWHNAIGTPTPPKSPKLQDAMKKAQESSLTRLQQTRDSEDPYTNSVLAVSALFVIFELPIGIMCFLSTRSDQYSQLFRDMAFVLDMLPFVRNVLLLPCYFILSSNFRNNFFRTCGG